MHVYLSQIMGKEGHKMKNPKTPEMQIVPEKALSGAEIRGVAVMGKKMYYFTDNCIYSYGPQPNLWERFKAAFVRYWHD
jgi:hypothetical protein